MVPHNILGDGHMYNMGVINKYYFSVLQSCKEIFTKVQYIATKCAIAELKMDFIRINTHNAVFSKAGKKPKQSIFRRYNISANLQDSRSSSQQPTLCTSHFIMD